MVEKNAKVTALKILRLENNPSEQRVIFLVNREFY